MHKEKIETILKDLNSNTEEGKKRAVDTVFEYLYFNLRSIGIIGIDEDMRSDFTLWFYPQIPHVLERFDSRKAKLWTYIQLIVRYAFITFKKNLMHQQAQIIIGQKEEVKRIETILTEKENNDDFEHYPLQKPLKKTSALKQTKKKEGKKDEIYKRTLLLLACKACLFIDEKMINAISEKIEMPLEELYKKIELLQQASVKKSKKIQNTLEKRNLHYIRYQSSLQELLALDPSTARYRLIKNRYIYNYNLWMHSIAQNKIQNKAPSNRTLAKYLKISRGTIDQNIAQAENRWYPKE